MGVRILADLGRSGIRSGEVQCPDLAVEPVHLRVHPALVEPEVCEDLVEWAGEVVVPAFADELAWIAVHG